MNATEKRIRELAEQGAKFAIITTSFDYYAGGNTSVAYYYSTKSAEEFAKRLEEEDRMVFNDKVQEGVEEMRNQGDLDEDLDDESEADSYTWSEVKLVTVEELIDTMNEWYGVKLPLELN